MRVISWVILGLMLSLLPLVIVAAMKYGKARTSFLTLLSNEELIAVAFTLSGAAAADVLVGVGSTVRRGLKIAKWTVGCFTLLVTMLNIAAYVLFRGHLTSFSPGVIITTVQVLYTGTAILSFMCELLSEF